MSESIGRFEFVRRLIVVSFLTLCIPTPTTIEMKSAKIIHNKVFHHVLGFFGEFVDGVVCKDVVSGVVCGENVVPEVVCGKDIVPGVVCSENVVSEVVCLRVV